MKTEKVVSVNTQSTGPRYVIVTSKNRTVTANTVIIATNHSALQAKDPNDPANYANRAAVMRALNRNDDAIADLRKGLTLNPGASRKKQIETNVYNHEFFVIDGQPSGPDFAVKFPFDVKAGPDTLGGRPCGNLRLVSSKCLVASNRAPCAGSR